MVAPDTPSSANGGDPDEPEPAVWLEDRREPEYANHFIFCVNCDFEAVAARHRGRLRLEAAPVYNRYVRSLEHTVQELWRMNNQLDARAAGHLGLGRRLVPGEAREGEGRLHRGTSGTGSGEAGSPRRASSSSRRSSPRRRRHWGHRARKAYQGSSGASSARRGAYVQSSEKRRLEVPIVELGDQHPGLTGVSGERGACASGPTLDQAKPNSSSSGREKSGSWGEASASPRPSSSATSNVSAFGVERRKTSVVSDASSTSQSSGSSERS